MEWLGDVPEHWEVKRLKLVVNRRDSKREAEETFGTLRRYEEY